MLNLICLNDNSSAVKKLQQALNVKLFLQLPTDGDFQPNTEAALKQFQRNNGLTIDGVAGPATIAALGLNLKPMKLNDADYVMAANRLGVTVAHVRAVTEVESRGSGFLDSGDPVILFERHKFWKYSAVPRAGETAATALARRAAFALTDPDICGPKALSNKKGTPEVDKYLGGEREWGRMRRAMAFHPTAALMSASYGLFQVMGFNAVPVCKYASVQAYYRAMQASEGDQLDAFVRFVKADPRLHRALKEGNWAKVAEYYNGTGYKLFNYDSKLANAFIKWRGH